MNQGTGFTSISQQTDKELNAQLIVGVLKKNVKAQYRLPAMRWYFIKT
jgi:hypothetical protein